MEPDFGKQWDDKHPYEESFPHRGVLIVLYPFRARFRMESNRNCLHVLVAEWYELKSGSLLTGKAVYPDLENRDRICLLLCKGKILSGLVLHQQGKGILFFTYILHDGNGSGSDDTGKPVAVAASGFARNQVVIAVHTRTQPGDFFESDPACVLRRRSENRESAHPPDNCNRNSLVRCKDFQGRQWQGGKLYTSGSRNEWSPIPSPGGRFFAW